MSGPMFNPDEARDAELPRSTVLDLYAEFATNADRIKRGPFGTVRVQRSTLDPHERIRIEGHGWSVQGRIDQLSFEREESNLIDELGITMRAIPEPPRTMLQMGSIERPVLGDEVVVFLDRPKREGA